MDTQSLLFEQHRRRMFGIAYRILGSIEESEDVVQETWLRWREASEIREPAAWLTRVVGRLALDILRSAYKRRAVYIGPWLPEPVESSALNEDAHDPVRALILRDAASTAFLRMMGCLSPAERVAFVMRQVFDLPYEEIALMLERTEEACRQLVSRATRKLGTSEPPTLDHEDNHQMLLFSFLQALQQADIPALQRILSQEVSLYSDGGGEVSSARRPLFGFHRVSRFCLGLARKSDPSDRAELVSLNGNLAVLIWRHDHPFTLISITCHNDTIHEIQMIRSPRKIRKVCALLATSAP
ncbi:RNA polymerase sigma factor SigJ [Myxococcota bacterium]|nr:RNA polymerase sigma factor SigJ [Myxococcota bacterium]